MNNKDEIDEYWNRFIITLPVNRRDQTYLEASSWGNSPELADEIASLIRSGIKTATSSLLWSQQIKQWATEKPGDKSIVLDSKSHPVCIVEYEQVFIRPFNQVDPDFVYHYGEGERTMQFWNINMWEYYRDECIALGKEAEKDMPVICQIFKVIYNFSFG